MIYAALIVFAALWWAALVFGPQVEDLRIAEWHHAHLGVALAILGLALDWPVLAWVGVGVLADDAVAHSVQRWLSPNFQGPLHRLYRVTLWRIPMIQRLNRWLDGG